ncbi:FecR family protein [Flavivirga spongiicola]|uniref:DUF4974 domain-containing protein n=1 Tax=Flavivirga spongiicola TaxID=421621 RepID=A0ABU7XQ00_9FLAO|nr:FecR domain-containing protein [Flavivirga sp. MEBiC05379]MDO5977830.1 DUF4974 domain-containing protein [Flavivirga sp. MEBiC05379]
MNTNDVNNQDFQELIEKYLNGETTLEQVKQLVNYYESFQQNHEWVETLGPESTIKNRMLINILEVLQDEDTETVKVIPFYKKALFKYGVAASIVLLISLAFIFNKGHSEIVEPIIVNNNIKVGTDKATLTLGDGTEVALEKGQTYIAANLSSNGEELVYNDSKNIKPEIVYNYLTIPRGGQYAVKLSDGTQVWLNSESKLKYPVNFIKGETRVVELVYGEAYFDVSPSTDHNGAKFKVHASYQEIEVLGTEFNVSAYKDETTIYTTLVEGKVAVTNGNTYSILSPEQQSIIKNGIAGIEIVKADVYSVTSWRKGIFSFDRMPFEKVMKVLTRWYDINVVFVDSNLKQDHFTGILRKNQSIEEILESITTNNIAYEINNNTVIFK